MSATILKMIIDFVVKIIMSFIEKQKAIESPDGQPDRAIIDDIKKALEGQLEEAFADLKKSLKDFLNDSEFLNEEKLLEIVMNIIVGNKEIDLVPFVPSSIEIAIIKTMLRVGIKLIVATAKKMVE